MPAPGDPIRSRLAAWAMAHTVPLNAQVDLTYRCNERCIHCYRVEQQRAELTTDQVAGVLADLRQLGTLFLTLSGGEVFLREDLWEVLAQAQRLHLSVRLKTNGLLVDGEAARRLRDLGATFVDVSLYGSAAPVHDSITGVTGSFDHTVAHLRGMVAAGLHVRLAICVLKANQHDVLEAIVLGRSLGVDSVQLDPIMSPRHDGDAGPTALGADREALWRLGRSPLIEEVGLLGYAREVEPGGDGPPCGAGHSGVYVSPYGDVSPCVAFPLRCGNVREAPLAEIWRSSPVLRRYREVRRADLRPPVEGGDHGGSYARCPGYAYLAHGGDYCAPVDEYGRVGRILRKARSPGGSHDERPER